MRNAIFIISFIHAGDDKLLLCAANQCHYDCYNYKGSFSEGSALQRDAVKPCEVRPLRSQINSFERYLLKPVLKQKFPSAGTLNLATTDREICLRILRPECLLSKT